MHRAVPVIALFFMFQAEASSSFLFSTHLGGNLGFLIADSPEPLVIKDREVKAAPSLGTRFEVRFNDYIGLMSGVSHEKRGTLLRGQAQGGSIVLAQGSIEFEYEFLQIPIQARASLPLLIPASLFIHAGPEVGILLGSSQYVNIPGWNIRGSVTIDSLTRSFDFGISVTPGFELETGRSTRISIYTGYYWGLLDMYRDPQAENDYDLFTRSIRFGIALTGRFGH